MKILTQLFWILFFLALGNVISYLVGGFLPGSVVGMILLFLALKFRILSSDKVDKAARILTQNMGLFFVPAGVGLLTQWDLIKVFWLPISVSMVLSTLIVLAVVAYMQSRFEKRKARRTASIFQSLKNDSL